MNDGPELGNLPNLQTSMYFCTTCGKPFDQEISYTRHSQYCRRRAAKKRPARQQACQFCRSTKSKCDFLAPCTRCVTKNRICSYDRHYAASTSAATHPHDAVSSPSDGNNPPHAADLPPAVNFNTSTSMLCLDVVSGLELAPQPDNLAFNNDIRFDDANPTYLDQETFASATFPTGDESTALPCLPDSAVVDMSTALSTNIEFDPFPFVDTGPHQPAPDLLLPFSASASPSSPTCQLAALRKNMYSLVPIPARIINTQEKPSGPLISNGCCRFIVSILRTYPRMMTRPDNLPPFVHPIGCGLHFDQEESRRVNFDMSDSTEFVPLKPLAACHSIAQMFVSRNSNSEEFIWRTIESEQRRIMNEMHEFSRGEIVAAIQAMMIYTIMRLVDSGREYFVSNRDMFNDMKKLTERFSQLFPGPLSPTHERKSRPSWEEWIFEETRRRLYIVCFLIALVVGTEGSNDIETPFYLPLPGTKSLWEARSQWAWEKEYSASWKDLKPKEPRLGTVGDLAIARLQQRGGANATVRGNLKGALDEILDNWHADLDGLGMMLAAVVADV
ncbi:hypothetical protein AUP68_17806 [Ilyonectria robusta]